MSVQQLRFDIAICLIEALGILAKAQGCNLNPMGILNFDLWRGSWRETPFNLDGSRMNQINPFNANQYYCI
jgi:hypothetical protein